MQRDRRHAHRFPLPEDRQDAILKVGDESIPARLVDESSIGFALEMDSHPGIYEGELVWLKANDRWVKARVARVRQKDPGVEVGLTRLAAEVDEDVAAKHAQRRPWFRFWRMPQNHRVPMIIAVAVLLTVTLVTVLRLVEFGTPDPSVKADQVALDIDPHEDRLEQIRKMGAEVFIDRDVVKGLGLTRRQLGRILAIIDRSKRAAAMARETGATAEDLRRIQLRAQEDARHVLDRWQQARWDEMMRRVENKDAGLD